MHGHVLYPRLRHWYHDLFIADVPLWLGQDHVEIACHNQFVYLGALSNVRDNALYDRGIIRGQVSPHYKPLLI